MVGWMFGRFVGICVIDEEKICLPDGWGRQAGRVYHFISFYRILKQLTLNRFSHIPK